MSEKKMTIDEILEDYEQIIIQYAEDSEIGEAENLEERRKQTIQQIQSLIDEAVEKERETIIEILANRRMVERR